MMMSRAHDSARVAQSPSMIATSSRNWSTVGWGRQGTSSSDLDNVRSEGGKVSLHAFAHSASRPLKTIKLPRLYDRRMVASTFSLEGLPLVHIRTGQTSSKCMLADTSRTMEPSLCAHADVCMSDTTLQSVIKNIANPSGSCCGFGSCQSRISGTLPLNQTKLAPTQTQTP